MTIKNRILSAIVILLFNFSIANAQTFNKPTAYWGLNYYAYIEDTATQDPFMEEKTKLLPTIFIGYKDETSIRSTNRNSISWFAEAALGQVEYSNYAGTQTHTHNYWKIQTEAVYPLPENFYAGLGYRHLYDYLSDAGANGYDRLNQLLYIPVGYILNNKDGSAAKFQFNYLIEGKQTSYLSQMSINGGGYADLENTQKNGWGLDLSYTPKESNWEIFAKYWNIDDSTINTATGSLNSTTGLEPHNVTYEIGVKLAF
jgi:hypothetical protein